MASAAADIAAQPAQACGQFPDHCGPHQSSDYDHDRAHHGNYAGSNWRGHNHNDDDYMNGSGYGNNSGRPLNGVQEGVTYGATPQGNYHNVDARGWVAVTEVAIYVPVLVLAVVLMSSVSDRLWRRQWRWIYLNIFALMRVAGAAILVAAETWGQDSLLFAGTYALTNAGVSPLVMTAAQLLHDMGAPFLDEIPNAKHFFRGIFISVVLAVILAAVGGIDSSESGTSNILSGNILRKLSAFSLLAAFLILIQLHILYWVVYRHRLEENKKYFFILTAALPLLLVRIIYQILSAFSQNLFDAPPNPDIPDSLRMAPFNTVTGSVPVYIVMALLTEFCCTAAYIYVGTRTIEETHAYVELDTGEEEMEEDEDASWRSHLLAGTQANLNLRRPGTTAGAPAERPVR